MEGPTTQPDLLALLPAVDLGAMARPFNLVVSFGIYGLHKRIEKEIERLKEL